MKILQLCAHSNWWSNKHRVESHDLILGKNIFDLPLDYGKQFDLIISAPPCDQFTKASSWKWEDYPGQFIKIALHCLNIQITSGKLWVMESVPGRIATFIPILKNYRITTWMSQTTHKTHILYGNFIILVNSLNHSKCRTYRPIS